MSTLCEVYEELDKLLEYYKIPEPQRSVLWHMARGERSMAETCFPTLSSFNEVPYKIRSLLIIAEGNHKVKTIEEAVGSCIIVNDTILRLERTKSNLDRPFDIIDKCSVFNYFMDRARESKVLNSLGKFSPDKANANKQCIVGLLIVLYRNKVFKEVDPRKITTDKRVTLQDVMAFGAERFSYGSEESCRKKQDLCIERALERIPQLREFDEMNKNNHLKY